MSQRWRWIDSGVLTPHENLALDSILVQSQARDGMPPTFRVFQVSSPTVLVGYHQMTGIELYRPFCEQKGIAINRRLTGGGAVYLDPGQLGWELICRKDAIACPKSFEAILPWVSRGVVLGLSRFGIQAGFQPRNSIQASGKALSPVVGLIEGETVLFQGILFLDDDLETMVQALQIPLQKLSKKEMERARGRVTSLKNEVGMPLPADVVKQAIRKGCEEAFGISFIEGDGLSFDEQTLLPKETERIRGTDWVYRIPEGNRVEAETLRAVYKANGNLLRIGIKVDLARKRIQGGLIAGDIMVSPQSALSDLEERLRGTPLDGYREVITRFFEECKPDILSLSAQDFIQAIDKALSRLVFYEF